MASVAVERGKQLTNAAPNVGAHYDRARARNRVAMQCGRLASDEYRPAGFLHDFSQVTLQARGFGLQGHGYDDAVASCPLTGWGQFVKRRVCTQHHASDILIVSSQREQQQPELMMLTGRTRTQQPRPGRDSATMMQTRTELVARVGGEEVLLRDAPLSGFPPATQFLEDGRQQLAGDDFDRVQIQR